MKIALICVLVALQVVAGQQCQALALAGGGGRGAYQAGVLVGLTNNTKGINFKYNAVSGISIGSVNAAALSNYPMGQEFAAAQYILSFWRSLNGSQSIFVEWPGGYIDGLLFQQGLVTNAPAISLAKIWITGPRMRNITVGSTNLDLGLFQTFNESVGLSIIDAVISSSSIPFMFPPHEYQGYSWADGGCITNLDVFSAVQRCLANNGGNEAAITIDMIYCDPIGPLKNETSFKTPDVFARVYQIHSQDSADWYTYNTMVAYPKVNYRYVIMPSEMIEPLLNFSVSSVEFDINLGLKDANTIINSKEVDGKAKITELYQRRYQIIYP